MRYGHSLLLSETIDAARLAYPDCAAMQIVCPICREPVFKAVRERPTETHYLAHYAAAAAYAAECEMRVGRLDPREIEQQNIVSRGQKLRIFLRVLQQAIKRRDYGKNDPRKVDTILRLLGRSKPISVLYLECVKDRLAAIDEAMFQETAEHYVNHDMHPGWRTGFALATQRRIAWDVWRTLQTPPEETNRRFLWLHGYAFLLARMQNALDHGVIDEPLKVLRNYAERLIQAGRARGMDLLAEMGQAAAPQGFAEPGSTYLRKLLAEITHETIGCLVRLDYFDILRAESRPAPL